MKKIIIVLFIITICAVLVNGKESILIPDDAIRFRVIANSNSVEDQNLKKEIKIVVEKELYEIIGESSTLTDVRNKISENIYKIENIMDNYNIKYDISYGNNYFPAKTYKGINYEAGNYESFVITLGSGIGDNWWCVLFPPLCLLDEKKNIRNAEYKFYVEEIINKFLK